MKTEKSKAKRKQQFCIKRASVRKWLLLSLVLMLMSGLFTGVFAYDACGKVDSVVLDQNGRKITYYDIYGGKTEDRPDTSDQTQFYKDIVTQQDNLLKWANLAYNIFGSDDKTYWDHRGKGWDEDFGNGGYIDFITDIFNPRDKKGDGALKCTGISIAESLKDVQERAADDIAHDIGRKVKGSDFMDHHKLDKLTDAKQTVIYSTISQIDRYGKTPQYGYNAFTIAFYDFQLRVIDDGKALNTVTGDDDLAEATSHNVPGFSYSSQTTDDGIISLSQNDSFEDSATTLNLEESTSSTVTNSFTNSQNYTVGANLGFNASLAGKIPLIAEGGFSVTGGISFGETTEMSSTEENSVTKSETKSSSATMTVPAHTAAVADQTKAVTKMTTAYDCPVGVTYKVAIFSMCGSVYDDNAWNQSFSTKGYDQRTFLTIFGSESDCSDAVENLYQRAFKNKNDPSYEQTYGYTYTHKNGGSWTSKLNWNTILNRGVPKCRDDRYKNKLKKSDDMINALINRYPMSVTGGSMSIVETGINSKIGEPIPLYPISVINIKYQLNRDFDMKVGGTLPIYSYRVNAYDEEMVPYYGFVPSAGEWKIVDANGNPTESGVARMTLDPVLHQQCVEALSEGTAYVKYFINDGDYVDYNGRVSKNENISSPAYRINVAGEEVPEFTGRIDIDGDVTATVNGDPINLNAVDTLTVTAYDTTDRQADINVSWEAQELSKNGISVTPDGVLTVTQPGTFHVRAYCDGVYSAWAVVNAVNEKELIIEQTDQVITGEQQEKSAEKEFDSKTMITRGEFIEFLHSMCGMPSGADGFSFSDVDKDALYSFALNWAKSMGFINGVTENTFKPDQGLTRQQMAVVVFRVAKAMGYPVDMLAEDIKNVLIAYSDSDRIPAWAEQAMAYAVQNGFIKPDENGNLNGDDYVDKSEAADVIVDTAEMIPSEPADDTADNSDADDPDVSDNAGDIDNQGNDGDTDNSDNNASDTNTTGDSDTADGAENTEHAGDQTKA